MIMLHALHLEIKNLTVDKYQVGPEMTPFKKRKGPAALNLSIANDYRVDSEYNGHPLF